MEVRPRAAQHERIAPGSHRDEYRLASIRLRDLPIESMSEVCNALCGPGVISQLEDLFMMIIETRASESMAPICPDHLARGSGLDRHCGYRFSLLQRREEHAR